MTAVILAKSSLRDRKKAATRKVIFETAVRLFAERGFDSPTIDEIASEAAREGTVYNYFSSKEEILVEFMVEVEARVQKRIGRFAEANAPLHRILSDLLRFQFRLKRPYLAFARVFRSGHDPERGTASGPTMRMQS